MTSSLSPYPEDSQATVVLVLGILSLICFPPLGIVAWVLGNSELKAIDEGRRPPENRGTASAGKICGIIGTCLFALFILLVVALLALGGFAAVFDGIDR